MINPPDREKPRIIDYDGPWPIDIPKVEPILLPDPNAKPKLPTELELDLKPAVPSDIMLDLKLIDPVELNSSIDPRRGINEAAFPPAMKLDDLPLVPSDINWHDPPSGLIFDEEYY